MPGVVVLNNGSFIIQRVTPADQAKYHCTPYNTYGTSGPSSPMEVLVRGKDEDCLFFVPN